MGLVRCKPRNSKEALKSDYCGVAFPTGKSFVHQRAITAGVSGYARHVLFF